ncbi:uncharacterized protein LOC125178831, partial [Hyalella azteca]|uniref:Uncharacterized protein LOC125178831 n=1 Tax=Hyalella azteca TaxID=294128 RepID=A0A979FTN5_HYAAZ
MPLNGTFIMGQEQDLLGGGFNAQESFRGKIALLNIWNYTIDQQKIMEMSECRSIGNGNMFSLQKNAVKKFNVSENHVSMTEFCADEDDYWLLDGPNTFQESVRLCRAFGGSLHAPNTKEAVTKLYDYITDPNCVCKFITNVIVGITDEKEEGNWSTIASGETMKENFFLVGEPNGGRGENCAVMSRKVPAFIDYNCEEIWPYCAPCVTYRPLRIRGLCFNSEAETFMDLKGYVNESIFIRGYYGINIHNMLGTSEWHIFDSNLQKVIAEIHLSSDENYPIGRKMWTLKSKTCNHREGSLVPLVISPCNREEYACKNADCIPRSQLCDGVSDCVDLSDENSCNILGVPEGYKIIRPPEKEFGNTGPISMSVHVDVLRFLEVDDIRNLINLEAKIEMKWRDRRLTYYNLGDKIEDNELPISDLDRIWTPTLVFPSVY